MKVICSHCKKKLGEKEPLEDQGISHGICEECVKIEMKKIEEFGKEEENKQKMSVIR